MPSSNERVIPVKLLRIAIVVCAFGVLATTICVTGCGGSEKGAEGKSNAGIGEPLDYFPASVGTKWVYQVTVSEDSKPLQHRVTRWPLGERSVAYASRGYLCYRALEDSGSSPYTLAIRVKARAPKQGSLEYPNGVELEVERDDLGIFSDAKQIFWAIGSPNDLRIHQVVTYSPDTPGAPSGAWGSWGQEDGYSMQLIFFGERPGTQIGELVGDDEEPLDSLTLVTAKDGVLCFIRSVVPDSDKESSKGCINNGFTEAMFFERGKGLTSLVQQVNKKTSMTWKLVEFTDGSGE